MDLNTQGPNSERTKELPHIDVGRLMGSDSNFYIMYEVMLAIQAGKLSPLGFDRVFAYYKEHKREMTGHHCMVLYLEANSENRLEELRQYNAGIEESALLDIHWFQRDYPQFEADILQKVGSIDYTPEPGLIVNKI